MKDYIVKSIAYDGMVRAYAATTTQMVQEACRRQDTWPTTSAALGRTLTITGMMGTMLKGEDTITTKIESSGPVGAIVADANAHGQVRGYVNEAHVDFPSNEEGKLDVGRAVGNTGTLSVVKDLGLKDYFTGQVPLVTGEIGDDFTYYFATSEQVPSAVAAGVLVDTDYSIKASGGFIVQLMPGASEEIIDKLEENINQMPQISSLIDGGATPEDILHRLFKAEDLQILEKEDLVFKCKCSRKRMMDAIKGLGQAEIESMIEEDHGAEATCHFCNEVYEITETELQSLL